MLKKDPEDRPTIKEIMQDFERYIIYASELKNQFDIQRRNVQQLPESDEFGANFFTLSTENDSKKFTILVYQW